MPQCLPSCDERSLGSRTPRLANPKPRRCLHGNQITSVAKPAALCNKKPCQAMPPPPSLHTGANRQTTALGGKERKEYSRSDHSTVTTLSWHRAHGSLHRVCPPTCGVCVCIYIYIYLLHFTFF